MRKINWSKIGRCMPWCVISFILAVIGLSMIEGMLIVNEVIEIDSVKEAQKYLIALLTFIACFVMASKTMHGKLVVSVAMGMTIFLILMIIKMVFSSSGIVNVGMCSIVISIPMVLAGLMSVKKKIKR